jgi:hypothetical protein
LRDCDGDKIPDVCGELCPCQYGTTPGGPSTGTTPQNTDLVISDTVEQFRGENKWNVKWTGGCPDTTFDVLRCESEKTQNADPADCVPESWVARSLQARAFLDTVQPGKKYCYKVTALCGSLVSSQPKCFVAGDEICYEQKGEFCQKSDPAKRFTCDANNKITVVQDCTTVGEKYVCAGPFSQGNTICTTIGTCDKCNEPFGVFADFTGSVTQYEIGKRTVSLPCKDAPFCYYDYSEKSMNMFFDCIGIDTCYDYRSKAGCDTKNTPGFGWSGSRMAGWNYNN